MIRFNSRVSIPEKMDDPDLSADELLLALADIRNVNRFLGGHRASLRGFNSYISSLSSASSVSATSLASAASSASSASLPRLTVVDMGCGDGEYLRFLAAHCRRVGLHAHFIGWDMNPKSLEMARTAASEYPEIRFECRNVLGDDEIPDNCLITCNLFLHHFSTAEIKELLLRWKKQGARAVIINDLHRNAIAYYLFRLFGAIFMRSPVARYDGAVSIRRGFQKSELLTLVKQAGGSDFWMSWRWAFRWLCCIRFK